MLAAFAAGVAATLGIQQWAARRPRDPVLFTPPQPLNFPVNAFFGRAYLIDADGDGVLDVMGQDYVGGVFVVSGKTGERLWDNKLPVEWYAGQGRLVLGWKEGTFDVHGVDARSGRKLWTRQLSDAFVRTKFGDDCVVVETRDGGSHALAGRTGAPTRCDATSPWYTLGFPTQRDPRFDIKAVGSGTAQTLVIDSDASGEHWRRTLDFEPPVERHGQNPALVDGAVIVAGKKRSNPSGAFFVYRLDAQTGAILQSIEVSTPRSIHALSLLSGGGGVVFAENSGTVYAFDAATLARKWTVGSSG